MPSIAAPLVLALETSTPQLSCALLERTSTQLRVLGVRAVSPPAVVSTLVPGLFDELLQEAGARRADLGVVVSGLGPGLFTGARVAVATMKAIAYALSLPLLGAGSLESMALTAARGAPLAAGDQLALDAPLDSGPICPVIDARKGEVYLAVGQWTTGAWQWHVPPEAARPDRALALIEPSQGVVPIGAGLGALGRSVTSPAYPLAAECAYLALRRDPAPRFDPAAVLSVEPAYLRPPEAEVARRRRLAAAG